MIKINLLPQRKPKRQAAEPGSKEFVFGMLGLVATGAAVFLFVDKPRRDHLAELKATNAGLQARINQKTRDLQGYAELKTSADEADKRAQSINRLISAKIVPANILHELGEILTSAHQPTMTDEMTKQTSNTPSGNPNKRFQTDWDAMNVWMSSFTDTNGVFKLEGGAQSEQDVAQLSKRLAASVYFTDVTPAGGQRVNESGISYFKYTITGKVAY
ncbi:MAG: PilN domain-containing protein [Deltaproteobacteria bacterium]|nr:PilN domain-containing protein [Deltaproteobacteria bacterium]